MEFSTKLLLEDPILYSMNCGVMDSTIHNLDQQIILNDILLFANGGMPYWFQDPIPQNHPSALDNSWQFYQNVLKDIPISTPCLSQTAAAATGSHIATELCDRTTALPPIPDTRNSARPPYRLATAAEPTSSTAAGPISPPHQTDWGGAPVAKYDGADGLGTEGAEEDWGSFAERRTPAAHDDR
ncbi:hypothetical protein PGQ11_007769 [Apiospora arundinis]|uniref:Uncharacterized protein n=1 Tax=Apiospora arundinis TaxID=335852 RepID=A0ABR2IX45_9PEZI